MKEKTGWFAEGLIYQIYVRSFADSNGDGHGDIPGIVSKLGYLSELGVDALWLTPVMPSPNADWGYDVEDYYGIHPDFGNLEDLKHLVQEASKRNVAILLDLVPNHTSSKHPWFISALADAGSRYRSYYVFAPGKDGGPPNNWLDATGASAWTYDESSGEYYLHNFLPEQPDLNWWNQEVRLEFERIIRYWFDLGIAGFRIDVAHGLIKDSQLRDDPVVAPNRWSPFGREARFSKNRPEVHEIYKRWRRLADEYQPNRVLMGETWVGDLERLAAFYGKGDELDLCLNFVFMFSQFEPRELGGVVQDTLSAIGDRGIPVWAVSNHDVSRMPTRWAGGDVLKARLALTLLLTLPGVAVLYYGDEIGMGDADIEPSRLLDEMSRHGSGFYRDRARAPMQWDSSSGRGFTRDGTEPWLPFGQPRELNVADQIADKASTYWLVRQLARLRKREGHFDLIANDDYLEYWSRGLRVMMNFSDEAVWITEVEGNVLSSINCAVTQVQGGVTLKPWEALVLFDSEGGVAGGG
jgi:alpha-glucosidase